MPSVLSLEQLSKRFGGVQAVQGLSLELRATVIHGLIGPNGAGKTTVINLATGIYQPDEGEVRLAGDRITAVSPVRRARLGLVRTYQTARLFDEMTTASNLEVALLRHRDEGDAAGRALALLEQYSMAGDADKLARDLPHGRRKLLEVIRAVSVRPRVLLLDEPAAGLGTDEIEILLALLRSCRSETAIMLVEHDMDVVNDICDHVTVMDAGRQLAAGAPDAVMNDPAVIEAYLGVA